MRFYVVLGSILGSALAGGLAEVALLVLMRGRDVPLALMLALPVGCIAVGVIAGAIAAEARAHRSPHPTPRELIDSLAWAYRRFERGKLSADEWVRQRESIARALLGPPGYAYVPLWDNALRYWGERRARYSPSFQRVMDDLIARSTETMAAWTRAAWAEWPSALPQSFGDQGGDVGEVSSR